MKHINIVVSKLRNCKLNGAIFFLFLAFALRLDLEGSLDERKKENSCDGREGYRSVCHHLRRSAQSTYKTPIRESGNRKLRKMKISGGGGSILAHHCSSPELFRALHAQDERERWKNHLKNHFGLKRNRPQFK